jgi:hypothetical protein
MVEFITLRKYPEEIPVDIFVKHITHYTIGMISGDAIVNVFFGEEFVSVYDNMRTIREKIEAA